MLVSPATTLPAAPKDNVFRLLLIESDPEQAQQIIGFLSKTGFDCRFAPDTSAGLQAIETTDPHLLILHSDAPDGGILERDAVELCGEIRQSNRIPILVFGPPSDSREISFIQNGADDFLPLPLRPQVFLARVVAALRRTYRYAAPQKEEVSPENPTETDEKPFWDDENPTEIGFLPENWARCDACGFQGQREKFEKEDLLGNRKVECPQCRQFDYVVFSLG